MSDDVVVCTDQAHAVAIAAKINASSRVDATEADRADQTGRFRPLSECGTTRYTEPVLVGTTWCVPVPDANKHARLSAAERALIGARPTITRDAVAQQGKGR